MPRQRSAQPRYRRRVVLELTPDESVVLDALADRHGTIRGAVLAGLHQLETDRTARLEAQLEALNEHLATAQGEADAERERASAELTAQHKESVVSRQARRAAETKLKDLRADVRELKAKLAAAGAAGRASDQARLAAEALRVHHAYCTACDKLVPEAEWAEQAYGKGFATYHNKHAFRPQRGGFLGEAASMLFWALSTGWWWEVMTASEGEPSPKLSGLAGLFLLLIIILGLSARRRAAGGIRLATPTFAPLTPEAGHEVVTQLGAAVGELLSAEYRRHESQT